MSLSRLKPQPAHATINFCFYMMFCCQTDCLGTESYSEISAELRACVEPALQPQPGQGHLMRHILTKLTPQLISIL